MANLFYRIFFYSYKVYKVFAESPEHSLFLRNLEVNPKYDFWSEVNRRGKPVSVMVAPEEQAIFEKNLSNENLTHLIEINNVEENIKLERSYHLERSNSERITFDRYFSHADVSIISL